MEFTAAQRPRHLEKTVGIGIAALILIVPLLARADTVTLSAAQDSWIAEGSPNTNHSGDNVLNVRTGPTAIKQHALIQFNLSGIPTCAIVSSAVLRLTITNPPSANRTEGVHTVSKAWTEAGVTWNTTNGSTLWTSPGGDFNPTATATAMTGTIDGVVVQWTVTSDAIAFVANASSNHGWLIKDVDENVGATTTAYGSKENATASNRPQLVVTYTLNNASCDDGNVCTTDTCLVTGCQHPSNSAPCNDGLFCNGTDTCGSGTCSVHTGSPCPGPDGDTNCAESCNETLDNCTAADPNGTLCRPAAGPCDVAENCSGGVCPADGFAASGVCRAAAGACDVAESCNGSGPSCPADGVKPNTAVCRAAAGVCDVADFCDGSTKLCPSDAKSTAVCRPAAGVCDMAESCNGTSNTCPADAFLPASTVCRSGTPGQVCDQTEFCTGSGANCPADGVKPNTTLCRAAAGVCDLADFCNGSSKYCPADAKSTTGCRAAAGTCDVPESCNGSSDDCPPDGFKSSSTVCRAASAGQVCDQNELCPGNGPDCPPDAVKPNTTQCRAAAGVCDLAEFCDGSTKLCPADAKSTALCRAAAGVCDVAESCNGTSNTCPSNAFLPSSTVCRSGTPGEVCDQTEQCTGSGANCPPDGVKPNTTLCRAAAGVCDAADFCDGSSKFCSADGKSTAVCRAAADACDVAESCNGSSNACPSDAKQLDGTPCPDAQFCNGIEICQMGMCTAGTDPCPSQICDEPTDMCTSCALAPVSGCRTAEKSLLLIKDKSNDAKDKLIWKFIKGQPTSFAEMSDPRTSADYTLCIYAGAGGTLVGTLSVPASATLWKVSGNDKGYKYFDAASASDGVQKVLLKASDDNKTKARMKARGPGLPEILGPMGLDTPVTAQLVNHESGVCWQGSYTGTPTKNSGTEFKAKQ